ncbi:2-oxo acid dehydrogenase subunit E2 [Enterobacteriaceae bacterium ET-AT1-13]|nr:2-oxo acid dehydrogenase subunit E2 [Enterobacteriaceae bacterium ET-AT1-13]WMC17699.1 MAG: 2-oxo acid dehydrogenase subunit E2 [Enterobacteriaceae bacterium PSmelAO3-2]WMC17903.1 MAG: 2-oxo acid dehydrogenase subunit E2 [Enterobacteriaceae bacterium PSmelAO3-1]WMC18106.1 MAG: 2-oxo acid dehydrogenase subunit E2 [Enterobacteriaceae bacterium PSmelAO1]
MINEIKIPDIGTDEFEVTEIFIKVGDIIKKNQPLIAIEGDKTSVEIPSIISGIIKEIKINIGDKVKTNSLIGFIDIKNIKENIKNIKNKKYINLLTKDKNSISEIHASPLIRNLSRKFNIDLEKIKGSGLKGRIIKEDVQKYIENINISNLYKNNNSILKSSEFNEYNIEKIKINNLQITSGKNLLKSWVTIPHVTIFDNIDITDLEIFRKKQNKIYFNKKLKFTLLVFIIKAVAIVLNYMPKFNSSLSEDGRYLNIKKYINIGIAVETKKGLLVPNIKDVKYKTITEISKLLIEISQKARNGVLNKNDISNGSFTISSLGHIGTKNFTPIINFPEVAILGISRVFIKSIWNGIKFIPKLILPISFSFDHRVIDGADAARFIKKINFILSDIRNLIM